MELIKLCVYSLMVSNTDTNFFELGLVHPNVASTKPPVYLNYNDNLDGIDANGNVFAPEGPGIGVELDWDWINDHKLGQEIIAE